MSEEDRDADKKFQLVPSPDTGKSRRPVSLDVVKSAFIAEGLSEQEIADRYFLSLEAVRKVVEDHKLPELRRAYIREGVKNIQNEQVNQAEKLMDLELKFKKLRIKQLETQLEDYLAYYSRHGDFKKRHPVSGEVLTNTNGMPMYINVPNVTREISQLKEAVTMSEGMKTLLTQLDDILNKPKQGEAVEDGDDIIDLNKYEEGIFKRKP